MARRRRPMSAHAQPVVLVLLLAQAVITTATNALGDWLTLGCLVSLSVLCVIDEVHFYRRQRAADEPPPPPAGADGVSVRP